MPCDWVQADWLIDVRLKNKDGFHDSADEEEDEFVAGVSGWVTSEISCRKVQKTTKAGSLQHGRLRRTCSSVICAEPRQSRFKRNQSEVLTTDS